MFSAFNSDISRWSMVLLLLLGLTLTPASKQSACRRLERRAIASWVAMTTPPSTPFSSAAAGRELGGGGT